MLTLQVFSLTAILLTFANAQSDNGQYTWTPSTTEDWGAATTTTDDWAAITTSDDWDSITTTTPEYDWTSYTTVTSCYTENGLTITTTIWVPCPCDDNGGTVTTDSYPIGTTTQTLTTDTYPIGTTTQTLTTTTTPAYSSFTSSGIVYVVPISTPVTTTASAGVEIVNASDASKVTEVEAWIGILSAVVLGGFAVIAVLL